MPLYIDRFETRPRDGGGRVSAGWRLTRYTFGACSIQHLRTGRSNTGVVDDFGNVIDIGGTCPPYGRLAHDELVPFYLAGHLPPHWQPS